MKITLNLEKDELLILKSKLNREWHKLEASIRTMDKDILISSFYRELKVRKIEEMEVIQTVLNQL